MYDPGARVGGMIHYMLPASKIAPTKADARPAMFADTGVPLMLKRLYDLGARRETIEVNVAGGSQLMDQNKVFNIGERNFMILRKILWKNNLLIKAKDVGGSIARTLSLEMDTGKVSVKTSKGVTEL
jgi:chemotaxis protein CheD